MTRDLLGFDVCSLAPTIFSGLSAAARCDLGAALARVDLQAKVIPFDLLRGREQTVSGLAWVGEGYLREQLACENGRSQITTLFMPGDLIETTRGQVGRLLLETATPARLWVLRPDRAASLLSRHPSLCRVLAELRALKLSQTRWLADALARLTADERIICFLVLATRWMPWHPVTANAGTLTLSLPRADMANLLASSVETVSRVLTRLQAKGLIEVRNAQQFHLPDLAALCDAGRMASDWQSIRFARPATGPGELPGEDEPLGQPRGSAALARRRAPPTGAAVQAGSGPERFSPTFANRQ